MPDPYTILPNIYIHEIGNATAFAVALAHLVDEYGGYMDFDEESDIDITLELSEDDEPTELTLEAYLKGEIQ